MDTFSCGVCNSTFQSFSSFLVHKFTDLHGDLKACSLCTKIFPQGNDLLHHYLSYHKVDLRLNDVLTAKTTSPTDEGEGAFNDSSPSVSPKALNADIDHRVEHGLNIGKSESCEIQEQTDSSKPHCRKKLRKQSKMLSRLKHKLLTKPNDKLVTDNESQIIEMNEEADDRMSWLQSVVNPSDINSCSKPKSSFNISPEVSTDIEVYCLHQGGPRVSSSNKSAGKRNINEAFDNLPTQNLNSKKLIISPALSSTVQVINMNELEMTNNTDYYNEEESNCGLHFSETVSSNHISDLSSSGFRLPNVFDNRTEDSNTGIHKSLEIQNGGNGLVRRVNATIEVVAKKSSSTKPDLLKDFYFLLASNCNENNDSVAFGCIHCKYSTKMRYRFIYHMKQFHNDVLDNASAPELQSVQLLDHPYDLTGFKGPWNNYKVMKMSDYNVLSYKPPKKPSNLPKQDRLGQYPCSICNKVFTRLRFLRRHRVVHTNERPHLCDICGKSYKNREALRVHACQVKKREPYKCPECDFSAEDSKSIHRHRQLHPGGTKLCTVCGEVYGTLAALKFHARVHDLSRPFACSDTGCTWRFETIEECKLHELRHKQTKLLCPLCEAVFYRKQNLKRHIDLYHNKNKKKK